MYGLNVSKQGGYALFIKRETAERAVQRLGFAAHKDFKASVGRFSDRGEMKGYRVTLIDGKVRHIITDTDVERFGL
jgi:hypothetical protein